MSDDLLLGLQLSGIGLGVTFLALSLVILVMDLLVRIFPVVGIGEAVKPAGDDQDERRREQTAVALAVSVALMQEDDHIEDRDPTLGQLLED